MPLYDFRCPACETTVERLQRYADPPPTCATCGQATHRAVSKASFELKGEGWARDRYGLKTGGGQ